jgi:PAS domain S-box-containing protein
MDPNSALTALLASQLRQQGSNTFTSNTIPQNGTMNSPLFQQQFQQVSDDVYNNKLQAHQKNDMIKSESNKVNSKVSMPTMTLQNVTQSSSSNNQIRLNDYDSDERNDDNDIENSNLTMDEKKIRKRDLNRKSAQLSRKRKKLFIEELKEENDILRRKVEILRSIPDLVIVFDSGGNIEFVSQSVSQFLDFTPQELQGSSFWDRLSDDSVRQMKAAFMDALAVKSKGSQSTSLGNTVWNLSLLDKNGTEKFVSLNGTVHFYGDAPECVCSIRHRNTTEPTTEAAKSASSKPLETKNEGFTAKEIVEMSSKQQIKFKGRGGIPQISDADSSSAMSETTND